MMQQPSPDVAPVAPPPPPPPTPLPGDAVRPGLLGGPPTAQQMYEAARAQREELGNQLERLEDRRQDLANRLQSETLDQADRDGLRIRMGDLDARIRDLEKQIAQSDAHVAQTAAMPGAIQPDPPPEPRQGPPEEAFVLGGIFMFVGVLPISIALARRILRRGAAAVANIPKDLGAQLTRLEQGMESIALEVERIGEAQRFTARVLAEREDQRALGAGAAEPVPVRPREAAPERAR